MDKPKWTQEDARKMNEAFMALFEGEETPPWVERAAEVFIRHLRERLGFIPKKGINIDV